MAFQGRADIESALGAVGELLAARGEQVAIVVLGGAALNLLGIVDRSTTDVDIIALATNPTHRASPAVLAHPDPLPEGLRSAITTVARDFRLDPDWMNTAPALQWKFGLPPGLELRIQWREYAALRVGFVHRTDLVAFKLFAAADRHPGNVHFQDLIALHPTQDELSAAVAWVKTQDASPHFPDIVDQVVAELRRHVGS